MGILAGILGQSATSPATLDVSEFARAEGDHGMTETTLASNAMDQAIVGLDRLMSAALAVAAVNPTSKDGIQMARIHLAEAIASLDGDEEETALKCTAGLEDDTIENVGNEAWSSIKDFVKSVIEFIQKQWKKLKRFVAKYWNKYFGDVERLQKSWTKVQEEAKTKQTGYSLEKNAKGEFEKTSDYFYGGAKPTEVLSGDELAGAIEPFTKIARVIREKVLDLDCKDIKESDILTSEGALATKSTISGLVGEGVTALGKLFKDVLLKSKPTGVELPPTVDKNFLQCSEILPGKVRLYVCGKSISTVNSPAEMSEVFKATDLQVTDAIKQKDGKKKPSKVTIKLVDAATVESIADANLELLEEIHGIQRSKRLQKVEDELDKASKGLDAWKKNVPDDKDAPEKRTAFRAAVKIVTEAFSAQRRLKVNGPLSFCSAARLASSAHYDFCTRSLKAHKKD